MQVVKTQPSENRENRLQFVIQMLSTGFADVRKNVHLNIFCFRLMRGLDIGTIAAHDSILSSLEDTTDDSLN